ncbi:MAG: hypothetical protein ACU0B7_09305 [Paracoccaceae bacterium]|uniref:hypothetical protein n=1 Tax=Seohaeicola saemankumensis TaxID=481181 RepID=UPI001E31A387|nr:hypothetical protein [Seohaeicola saemankumensis]MCD1626219.1 hypothetical protein [Seohaeicola saemankumensis]
MSFVRPEVSRVLHRWRGVLTGAAVAAIGLWWIVTSSGLLGWVGWTILAAGLALAFTGLQRLRFAVGQGGPGVVSITEGQVAYFGPLTGGVVALSELTRLDIDHSGKPAHWQLHQPGQPVLSIPVTAENAGALFDSFAALPGLNTERLLAQMHATRPHIAVIWQRDIPLARLTLPR